MICQQATLSKLLLVQVQAKNTVQGVESARDHAWQLSLAKDIA